MLLSSLNTGSTDLRDTEVQQPNTTATLSLVISSRAFSANSGQFDAGSTTTASSFLPLTPPFLFSCAFALVNAARPKTRPAVAASQLRRLSVAISWVSCVSMKCHLPDAGVKRCERPQRPPALTESQEACHG